MEMTIDISDFASQADYFLEEEVPALVGRYVRKIGFDVFAGVVARTPVDEGRAKANWTMAAGEPNESVIPEGLDSYSPAVAPDLGVLDGSETIWVNNTLPYILPLEDGSSTQAPAGMVAVTVAAVDEGFR